MDFQKNPRVLSLLRWQQKWLASWWANKVVGPAYVPLLSKAQVLLAVLLAKLHLFFEELPFPPLPVIFRKQLGVSQLFLPGHTWHTNTNPNNKDAPMNDQSNILVSEFLNSNDKGNEIAKIWLEYICNTIALTWGSFTLLNLQTSSFMCLGTKLQKVEVRAKGDVLSELETHVAYSM